MNVTDVDGRLIEVTDLNLAIMQADDYRHYECSDKEMQARRQAYWEDLYQKMLALREDQ